MAPAHKRLDVRDPSGGELDLRLVLQYELVAIDARAQIREQREAARADVLLPRIEGDDADAGPLRHVHRDVRAPQERVRILAVIGDERDADRRLDVEELAVARERRLERAADRARDASGGDERRAGKDDRELVAAESRD